MKTSLKRLAVQKGKPIVQYGKLLLLQVGSPALLSRVYGHGDRGVHGKGLVYTSTVTAYHGLGSFETRNTIYAPKNPLDYDRTQDWVENAKRA
jgi:hypothetical protein